MELSSFNAGGGLPNLHGRSVVNKRLPEISTLTPELHVRNLVSGSVEKYCKIR